MMVWNWSYSANLTVQMVLFDPVLVLGEGLDKPIVLGKMQGL
jgi:hypothetical protein